MRHWYSHFHLNLVQTGWLLKHHLKEVQNIECTSTITLSMWMCDSLAWPILCTTPLHFKTTATTKDATECSVSLNHVQTKGSQYVPLVHRHLTEHTLKDSGRYTIHPGLQVSATCCQPTTSPLPAHHTSVSLTGTGLKRSQSKTHPWPAHKRQWKIKKHDWFRGLCVAETLR